MSYFKDSQDVYDTIGKLLQDLAANKELSPKFRESDTVLAYEFTEPEAKITLQLKGDQTVVEFGETEVEAEVVMSMAADTAHRFWLGQVNVPDALAHGEIKASGPVAKILKLVPLTKPAYPIYKAQLEAQGREDLIEA